MSLWVAAARPGAPLVPAIETARGVLAAQEIAAVPGVAHLSIGGLDLLRDLYAGDGDLPMLYVRSHLVVVSRAAGLPPPVDSVYPLIDDDAGLRARRSSSGRWGSRRSRRSTRGRSRSCTRSSPRRRATSRGRARCWRRSRRPAGGDPAAGRGVRRPAGAQRAQRMLDIAGGSGEHRHPG